MYVKIDGTIYNFCKNKCHKNLIELHRVPRRTRWTQPYMREKSSKISTKEKKAPKKSKGKPKPPKKMAPKKVPAKKPKAKETKAKDANSQKKTS
jgi:large subunit ribosomal protein L24e